MELKFIKEDTSQRYVDAYLEVSTMSNYNYMNKNGLKVMRIASMITSIIFTIIVIIASILCDLYIEEMSRALLVSLAIVLIILCCVVFIVITPF